jgi:hypothetical protein
MSNTPKPDIVKYHHISHYNYSKSFFVGIDWDSAAAFLAAYPAKELTSDEGRSRAIVQTTTTPHGYVSRKVMDIKDVVEIAQQEIANYLPKADPLPTKAE